MKKLILPLMVVCAGLAACTTGSDTATDYQPATPDCVGANCSIVKYSSPNGNDLVLETDRHIIQIEAQSNTPYSYYVWTGDKSEQQDPDLIVQDGEAMILVEE